MKATTQEHKQMIVAQLQGAVLALYLKHGRFCSVKDIAQQIGCSPDTVLRRMDKIDDRRMIPGTDRRTMRSGRSGVAGSHLYRPTTYFLRQQILFIMTGGGLPVDPTTYFLRQQILSMWEQFAADERARDEQPLPY